MQYSIPEILLYAQTYVFDNIVMMSYEGVIMAGGETWKSNRRFLLQHLRNLGMGKSFLENAIMKETHMLADYIEENYLDKPSEVDRCVNLSILNVVWLMVASKSCKYIGSLAIIR